MTRFYVLHTRNTRIHWIDAPSLAAAYYVANCKYGTLSPSFAKNIQPQSCYRIYDNERDARLVAPKAVWSGLSEVTQEIWASIKSAS